MTLACCLNDEGGYMSFGGFLPRGPTFFNGGQLGPGAIPVTRVSMARGLMGRFDTLGKLGSARRAVGQHPY